MRISVLIAAVVFCSTAVFAAALRNPRLDQVQKWLSTDVPRVLCLDESFATGGQPGSEAYAKAAAAGFRSVVSLRTANEGIDLARERSSVERANLRFFNIPVDSSAPRPEQADEFLRVARDQTNHPMLVTCATANRVGAFMMIFRVVEQGWSEEKALAEALTIGLRSDGLKKFAKDYIATHRPKG